MTSLSSEFKNLSPSKKGENFLVFVRPLNTVGGRPGNFLHCKSGIDCFGRSCY